MEKRMDSPTPKQGVVLSSGGADGAYAVGVLKALLSGKSPVTGYLPLDPVAFVGTSIGAFNASFLVSHLDEGPNAAVDGLVRVWLEELAENPRQPRNGAFRFRADPLSLLDPRRLAADPLRSVTEFAQDSVVLGREWLMRLRDFATSDQPLEQRAAGLLNFSSFVSSEPLLEVIQRNIDFAKIHSSKVALRIIATDWNHGLLEEFTNQHLTVDAGPHLVRASAAIPGFFAPVRIGDRIWVDGAVLGYTRLSPAIRAGWAARVNQGLEATARINHEIDALEKFVRQAGLSRQDRDSLFQAVLGPVNVKVTVHRYHPRDDAFGILGLLNLNRGRLEGLIERGFRDAVEHDCTHSKCILATPESG
jgi:predicted acylesterase/phospholipase RssA